MPSAHQVVFTVCCAWVIIVGLFDLMSNYEDNHCDMTWMYEWPRYDVVPLPASIKKTHSSYNLMFYSEGYFSHYTSDTKLTGIPVLFIPGNAGSHKQVRSLGSVALRRAEHVKSTFHFDFFSIDFNEEHSGIYGGVLQRQTAFVSVCVKKILSLYKHISPAPASVVLIGHSMGGMIARALFTLRGFDMSTVSVIITQSTPHLSPVIPLDHDLSHFYARINRFWSTRHNTSLAHVSLVSTGGGFRDILVRQGLTNVHSTIPHLKTISTCTMTVPKSWISTDHLCAVWCRQMVLVTVRSLFDIIDTSTQQVNKDPAVHRRVFKHHFITNNGHKYDTVFPPQVLHPDRLTPEIVANHLDLVSSKKTNNERLMYIPLTQEGMNLVAITNTNSTTWIGICRRQGSPKCLTIDSLSARAYVIPSPSSQKKVIHVGHGDLSNGDTLVFHQAKTNIQTYIAADLYEPSQRHIHFMLPGVVHTLFNFPGSIMKTVPILTTDRTSHALYYNVSLCGLDYALQAYTLVLDTKLCDSDSDKFEASTVILWFPWSHEHTNLTVRKAQATGYLSIKLQTPRPRDVHTDVQLHLYLQPGCQYTLSVGHNLKQVAGQLMRFYGVLLPALIVAHILISRARVTDTHDIASVVGNSGLSFVVVCISVLATCALRHPSVNAVTRWLGLPSCDHGAAEHLSLPSALLYPNYILCLWAQVVFSLHTVILNITLMAAGSMLSFLLKHCPASHGTKRGLHYASIVIVVMAMFVSVKVCGILGVLVCYLVKLFQVIGVYCSNDKNDQPRHAHLLSLLLWMWLCLLNSAPLIFLIKNLSFSWQLAVDPMRITAPLLCATILIERLHSPCGQTQCLLRVRSALYLLCAVLLCIYAVVAVYRVTYIVTCLLLLEALVNLTVARYNRIKTH